ncbi:MAG: hypothetical protein Q8K82_11885 [Gemmatimonadaceae bacterium]|nr:hypothetical protein [Gemmatimonadaceae bacterium]
MSTVRRRWLRLAAVLLGVLSVPADAQRAVGSQPEFRADVITSRDPTLQIGGGINVPAGIYARVGLTVAGGVAVRDRSVRSAARLDAHGRFLLDPFREYPVGVYGMGGISVMYDGFERWRPLVTVGLGLESRARRGHTTAFELALGGGVRVGVVMRRARATGR